MHRDVFMIRLADNWNEQILPHAWSGLVSQRSFWFQCFLTKKKIQRKRERTRKEADQMLLCSLQEKALRKLLFKMHFGFQNTIFYATGFGLIHTSAPLKPGAGLESRVLWMFSLSLLASNWYLWVARPSIMVKRQNLTHAHLSPAPNLYSCRSFLKNSISKPGPQVRAKPSLPVGVTAHFAWTLNKTLQDAVAKSTLCCSGLTTLCPTFLSPSLTQ